MKRLAFATLLLFTTVPAFAGGPDLSTPPATLRAYLAATKANDVDAAKNCWTIDDNNASGALDVVVGMWIASRRLVAATEGKFGEAGVKLLGRWNRPVCTDKAIDLTAQRIGNPVIKEIGGRARFQINWQAGDGNSNPAFMHPSKLIFFRKVGEEWKIDGNIFTQADQAAKLFIPGQIWPIWRDEMAIMNELSSAIEKGTLATAADFERELQSRVAELKSKYEKK